ncbi:X protein [Horseshoe bat hepatitis B virus]|uniref:Protein X n=1 Tax=Horseshoe bat hepatitis B virus TaxID=1508711 RepID=U3M9X8_9HEPA|nr:X protein [Horseshoe bat hepatitis B virus]AGW01280.1 X protein [Horseshoe bat hepatitis B virus]
MAARLHCELDAARDVLLLRPLGTQPGGRSVARAARDPAGAAAAAVPSVHRPHLPVRRLPACAFTPAGPCVLRFTCADLQRHMETTMNFVPWQMARQRGQLMRTLSYWDWYFKQSLMNQWEEQGLGERLNTYVLGGCRHKLR